MSGPVVAVGVATPADMSALEQLERVCFPADPWGKVALAAAFEGSGYLALTARTEQEIVGYLIGWEVAGEADLARIGVLPAFRGQGIGTKLLAAALDAWEGGGVERVFLDVRSGNQAALQLYARHGFQTIGLRRGYYQNGEDAIVMDLVLRCGK